MVVLAENEDKQAAFYALTIILRLADHEGLRPPLGMAGAIDLFLREMKNNDSHTVRVSVLNALCLCSRESVNRQRLLDASAFELFVSCLDLSDKEYPSTFASASSAVSGNYSMLYDRLISSLVNFVYDDKFISKLLELDLINVLMGHLFRVCDLEMPVSIDLLGEEISALASLATPISSPISDFDISKKTFDNVEQKENSQIYEDIRKEEALTMKQMLDREPEHQHLDRLSTQNKEGNEDGIENLALSSDPLGINNLSVSVQPGNESQHTDDLDQEVRDIVSTPQPSQSAKKPVFNINSPTYQLQQTSWNLQDYSRGVTCKSFGSEKDINHSGLASHPTVHMNESQNFVPYSPFSGGVSYYSPSYSPPYSSRNSSPKGSPNPYFTSPYLSSYSQSSPSESRGSPAWSLSTGISSPNRLSPIENQNLLVSPVYGNGPQSPSSLQPPFSPLSIVLPMSPLQPSQADERESQQSPIFNSQMSLMNPAELPDPNSFTPSQSISSQEIVSAANVSSTSVEGEREMSSSSMTEVNFGGVGSFCFSVVPLSQEELIYSDSEEDEVEDEYVEKKKENDLEVEGKEGTSKSEQQNERAQSSPSSLSASILIKQESLTSTLSHESVSHTAKGQEPHVNLKRSYSCLVPSSSNNTDAKKVTEICLQKNTSSTSSASSNCAKRIKFAETSSISVDDLSEKNKRLSLKSINREMFLDSHPIEDSNSNSNSQPSLTETQSQDDRLISHPFYKTWWKQSGANSVSKLVTASPPLGTVSPNPSISPFSRHGLSPYASPRCFPSPRQEHSNLGDQQKITLRVNQLQKRHGTFAYINRPIDSDNSSSSHKDRPQHHNQSVNTNINSNTSTILSTSSKNRNNNNRLRNILKTSESNAMILLSRVSIRPSQSQYLLQPQVFNGLLEYLSLASNPLQRCVRLLRRVCSSSLCFQTILLNQIPALIVKHLMQESDGSFPSALFHDSETGNRNSHSRQLAIHCDDVVPSSQNSDTASSQASEFGQKMEFEFGGDAYSHMTSSRFAASSLFRSHPSLSIDSQSAQDGGSSTAVNGGMIYDCVEMSKSNKKKVQIRIAMRLLHVVASLALSRFGDGEVKHIFARGSKKSKLQCLISLLHLLVAW